jgi:hypothetical protein
VVSLLIAEVSALTAPAVAGPKGTILVRKLGDAKITIDGDLKDWPLDLFTKVAEHPPFPEVQNSTSSAAMGDHIVFDATRIGRFNNTPAGAFVANDNDFGATLYFTYDAQFLYMLGVFIDDVIRDDRDTSEVGAQPYFNDGWEMLVDLKGDAMGCRPTGQDVQLGVALNANYKPSGSGDDVLGARQTLLVGTAEQMGSGAGQPDNVLEAAFAEIGGPNAAARRIADLRAAGARNPELRAKPNVTFRGYAIEIRIPFGSPGKGLEDFKPDHDMGFEVFLRDTDMDDDPNAGGINVKWASWAQSTVDVCNDDTLKEALLNTSNWGKLTFER